MKIQGIVIDFDGLIRDTETPELRSWESIYQEYGTPFPIKEYIKNIGSVLNDNSPIQYLTKKLNSEKIPQSKIRQKFNKLKSYLIEKEHLHPGTLGYLKEVASLGPRIGLASSSDSTWINYHINRLGLRKYFYCILTKDDANQVKPFPDIYLLSLSWLGLNNSEVIVFEDSLNGVSTAKSAQLFSIAIPNQATNSLNFEKAAIVLDSLSDLSLIELLQRLKIM
jgi:HAD superfamily hydrolase (TIGR01509 family)